MRVALVLILSVLPLLQGERSGDASWDSIKVVHSVTATQVLHRANATTQVSHKANATQVLHKANTTQVSHKANATQVANSTRGSHQGTKKPKDTSLEARVALLEVQNTTLKAENRELRKKLAEDAHPDGENEVEAEPNEEDHPDYEEDEDEQPHEEDEEADAEEDLHLQANDAEEDEKAKARAVEGQMEAVGEQQAAVEEQAEAVGDEGKAVKKEEDAVEEEEDAVDKEKEQVVDHMANQEETVGEETAAAEKQIAEDEEVVHDERLAAERQMAEASVPSPPVEPVYSAPQAMPPPTTNDGNFHFYGPTEELAHRYHKTITRAGEHAVVTKKAAESLIETNRKYEESMEVLGNHLQGFNTQVKKFREATAHKHQTHTANLGAALQKGLQDGIAAWPASPQ